MASSSAKLAGKRRPLAIAVVTLLTLGSGLLNLYSVMESGRSEHVEAMRRFFPLSNAVSLWWFHR